MMDAPRLVLIWRFHSDRQPAILDRGDADRGMGRKLGDGMLAARRITREFNDNGAKDRILDRIPVLGYVLHEQQNAKAVAQVLRSLWQGICISCAQAYNTGWLTLRQRGFER